MSGYWYKNGQAGAIVRIKLLDSSQSIPNNKGLTGLLITSPGLIIATMADVEATAVGVYTQSGGTLQTIAALGTYVAPSASNCRFKELDSTNFPGWYELQFLNARFAVSGAKYLGIAVPAVSGLNLAQQDLVIPLTDIDPYSRQSLFQAPMVESYSTKGSPGTPENYLFELRSLLQERNIVGNTLNLYGLDGTTVKYTCSYDNAASATTIHRTT